MDWSDGLHGLIDWTDGLTFFVLKVLSNENQLSCRFNHEIFFSLYKLGHTILSV